MLWLSFESPKTFCAWTFLGKNTLVILLQLYRLYVVHTENNKTKSKKKKLKYQQECRQRQSKGSRGHRKNDSDDIYIISNERSSKHKKRLGRKFYTELCWMAVVAIKKVRKLKQIIFNKSIPAFLTVNFEFYSNLQKRIIICQAFMKDIVDWPILNFLKKKKKNYSFSLLFLRNFFPQSCFPFNFHFVYSNPDTKEPSAVVDGFEGFLFLSSSQLLKCSWLTFGRMITKPNSIPLFLFPFFYFRSKKTRDREQREWKWWQ